MKLLRRKIFCATLVTLCVCAVFYYTVHTVRTEISYQIHSPYPVYRGASGGGSGNFTPYRGAAVRKSMPDGAYNYAEPLQAPQYAPFVKNNASEGWNATPVDLPPDLLPAARQHAEAAKISGKHAFGFYARTKVLDSPKTGFLALRSDDATKSAVSASKPQLLDDPPGEPEWPDAPVGDGLILLYAMLSAYSVYLFRRNRN
jgi:hypothetical protein